MAYESIDIKFDSNYQPEKRNGDFTLTSEYEGLLQDIILEALTQEGELFYDKEYGWSLYDFVNTNDDELTRIEISQRCKIKLSKYEFINQSSVSTTVEFYDDSIIISNSFSFIDRDKIYNLTLSLDRVNIEVTVL